MSKQTEAERLAAMLLFEREQEYKTVKYTTAGKAAKELRRLSAANAELVEALERIADPRNTHFAGDAQVVARAAIAKHSKENT